MFVLKTDHEFDWPVNVRVPVDGGKYASSTFTVRYRLPSRDEMKDLAVYVADESAQTRKVVVGWSDIKDESGAVVAFSPEALDTLIAVPWVRVAIWQGFIDAAFGIKRKNS